jgi:hypothetical protein
LGKKKINWNTTEQKTFEIGKKTANTRRRIQKRRRKQNPN